MKSALNIVQIIIQCNQFTYSLRTVATSFIRFLVFLIQLCRPSTLLQGYGSLNITIVYLSLQIRFQQMSIQCTLCFSYMIVPYPSGVFSICTYGRRARRLSLPLTLLIMLGQMWAYVSERHAPAVHNKLRFNVIQYLTF